MNTPVLPALALSLALLACSTTAQAADDRPNIILIMSDDMGYSDIGCYGGEIKTPTLDHLAANGVRFTQFYNTARCCPTRATLLSGLYAHQAGVGHMMSNYGIPQYQGELNRNCLTIAEVLKPAGYRTYMSGKWHVTPYKAGEVANPNTSNWPLQRGFDHFYGTIHGAGSFFDPNSLTRDNRYITPANDPDYQPETFYYTDAISDNAVRYIRDHKREADGQPFFMYVAYTAAHWPMHALPGDIAKYEGKYDGGYKPTRKARVAKLKSLGLLPDHWDVVPQIGNWESVKLKEWESACMEVYAAMVDNMDQGIGRIVAALSKNGQLDNTLLMYMQDNGGCAEGYGRANNSHQKDRFKFKPLGKDGLQTKIWPPMQTRDGRFVRTGPETMPGAEDTFVAYGPGWANTSNTPFRGYKHDPYEGGIGTPFIVSWPGGIAGQRNGTIVHDVSHLIDLMPTFVEVGGAAYPEQYDGNDIQPMEGTSLVPTLAGKAITRKAPLGFEHHGNLGLRDGKWKIVSMYRRDQPRKWELYDMEADRTELNDLAQKMPGKLKSMVANWQSWADRIGVQPWPIPRYDPKKAK
ncbi:MAG: arylsulfatase [Roseibacillus sp.]|nr:arylsulfatase [Roseibacillus sp.]